MFSFMLGSSYLGTINVMAILNVGWMWVTQLSSGL